MLIYIATHSCNYLYACINRHDETIHANLSHTVAFFAAINIEYQLDTDKQESLSYLGKSVSYHGCGLGNEVLYHFHLAGRGSSSLRSCSHSKQ